VHMTCWNFLPFLLRRVGVAPAWVFHLALGIWLTGVALLVWVLMRLRQVLAQTG